MPRFAISWTQRATIRATVTTDLSSLAAWAVKADIVRSLASGTTDNPDVGELTAALEENEHLRNALLQRWASSHSRDR